MEIQIFAVLQRHTLSIACMQEYAYVSKSSITVEQSNCYTINNTCTSLFKRCLRVLFFIVLILLNINIERTLELTGERREFKNKKHFHWLHFEAQCMLRWSRRTKPNQSSAFLPRFSVISNIVDNNHYGGLEYVCMSLVYLWHKIHWCTLYAPFARLNGWFGSNFNDRINS